MFVFLLSFFVPMVFLSACTTKEVIALGSIGFYKPMSISQELPKKPRHEIARLCKYFSIFTRQRNYDFLTLENLLKVARQNSNKNVFHNVVIWQRSWSIAHIYGQTCLLLGELRAESIEGKNH
ncbi:hypothetical protein CQA66_01060 [Helicobacter aurati]|uniref:Uncharacterized protein n=2 Tax=Helicobacter aurati TaxID=137778 RepID=A0A3D8J8H6_9HELI|nr:hypothetical protein CQA66_01060 [Helicobacter aurati]